MNDQDKERAKLEAWYHSFDVSEIPENVFRNGKHEERVRIRLLNRILAKLPDQEFPFRSIPSPKKIIHWMHVAAVFIFLLLTYPLYQSLKSVDETTSNQNPALRVTRADVGQVLKVRLSDGSEIFLNSGSVIQYPAQFTADKREIYLEGEAFVEVVSDPDRPFTVHTGDISTRVLGTSFNVHAYEEIDRVKVTVATGKVSVANNDKNLGELHPGEQLTYDKATGRYEVGGADAKGVNSWRLGELRLDGVSFDELALTIKNTWGYSLQTESTTVQSASFKATFYRNHTIEDVMKVISKITNARYQIDSHLIILHE